MDDIDMFRLLFEDENRERKSKGWQTRRRELKLNEWRENNKKNGKKYIPPNYNKIEMRQLLYYSTGTRVQHVDNILEGQQVQC